MIGNVESARQISELMFSVSKRLSETLDIARPRFSEEEFHKYAMGTGRILADIMYEVLNPIFAKHPSIEPIGWK